MQDEFIRYVIDKQIPGEAICRKINDNETFEGMYLGQINSKKGNVYFIINSSYVFNIKNSPTAENHIYILNIDRKLVGFYYVNSKEELPVKLVQNILYFKCKITNSYVEVSFEEGIPKFINFECNHENNFIEYQNDTLR
jgi:hypothetical protein